MYFCPRFTWFWSVSLFRALPRPWWAKEEEEKGHFILLLWFKLGNWFLSSLQIQSCWDAAGKVASNTALVQCWRNGCTGYLFTQHWVNEPQCLSSWVLTNEDCFSLYPWFSCFSTFWVTDREQHACISARFFWHGYSLYPPPPPPFLFNVSFCHPAFAFLCDMSCCEL